MSAEAWDEFIREIHAAPLELVLAVTGGGSRAISALLEVAGASRTVLEAVVPYSAAALSDWLGARPDHFCDDRTARAMAMAAYQRAIRFAKSSEPKSPAPPLAGVACTASLASDRPKRGAHRLHAALQMEALTVVESLELTKGARSRLEEEQLAVTIVLNLIAEACGLEERLNLNLMASEEIIAARTEAPPAWQDLLAGRVACASSRGERAVSPGDLKNRPRRAIFAGAFNPLHHGHRLMAQRAFERLQLPVEFEISILNVDKPPLDFLEMQRRAEQFTANEMLWFTTAATFVEKAAIFAPATFIVGADTIERIAAAKYYAGETACHEAIERLASYQCRFLVFGRQMAAGYMSLGDLALPKALAHICQEVSEAAFRADVSSTELRRTASQADHD